MPLSEGLVLVEDTRSCAADRYFVLTEEPARQLERPVAATSLTDADRGSLTELVERGYVVEHEGRLVSVVTRSALALTLRRARAQTASG